MYRCILTLYDSQNEGIKKNSVHAVTSLGVKKICYQKTVRVFFLDYFTQKEFNRIINFRRCSEIEINLCKFINQVSDGNTNIH